MFDNLSEKFQNVLSKLKNSGHITEKNIEDAVRDVRMALLEADVHVSVVRDLLAKIKARALGEKLIGSLSPQQQFLKIVQDELIQILGGDSKNLVLDGSPPHVILMVGLQGSGKTTSSAKLALHFRKKKNRRPFLVPADFYRPAAIDQLKTLAKQIDVPVYNTDPQKDPLKTVTRAVDEATQNFCDIVIIDTAGRLHVDEAMMNELKDIKKQFANCHILFVADAMTGQEAVNVAKSFHDVLNIDGVILTKMDGDAKGGAALSIQSVAQCPIYFMGMGEKLSEFEAFHPDRLVSRLLDRGDLISLIERAEEMIDEEQAKNLAQKFKKNEFDLEDFRTQLRQMKKLGSMSSLFKMLPGAKKMMKDINMDLAEQELKKKEAIINSMTIKERRKPKLLDGSRRQRIAKGSGTTVADINRFMKEFEQMKKMFGMMNKGGGGLNKMMNMFNR